MKKLTAEWVRKAEADVRVARREAVAKPRENDVICFHCQQAAEKYLKALLQEWTLPIQRTHDLGRLLDVLLPLDSTLKPLRRNVDRLTDYAVDIRYPGTRTTGRQVRAALQHMETARLALRSKLGLRESRTRKK
jgi:HEPN domain-containing protein